MRILLLHSTFIEYTPKKRALNSAPDAEVDKAERVENCLVAFCATEKKDEQDPDKKAEICADEIKKMIEQIGVEKVVLYPYVHLTSSPSNPNAAQDILKKVKLILSKDFNVWSSPFGWYKEFNIHVKGHPLAELSREF